MDKWIREEPIAESVIILLDPDMVITKPFINHMPKAGQFYVRKGYPVAQFYGGGPRWVEWKLCKKKSCAISDADGWKYYSAGPPYMMHISDWRRFAPKWVHYSPGALE